MIINIHLLFHHHDPSFWFFLVADMKLKMILRGICFFKFPPFADEVEDLCYLISVATALTKRRLDVMPAKSDESATLSLG